MKSRASRFAPSAAIFGLRSRKAIENEFSSIGLRGSTIAGGSGSIVMRLRSSSTWSSRDLVDPSNSFRSLMIEDRLSRASNCSFKFS